MTWSIQLHKETVEPESQYSTVRMRATWDGTGSVTDASKAWG